MLFALTADSSHRSRSNSTFQMPSWLRKRKTSAANARMTEHIRTQHPAVSIEQHFEAFQKAAIIRVDPLSKYIVSQVPVYYDIVYYVNNMDVLYATPVCSICLGYVCLPTLFCEVAFLLCGQFC